MIEYRVAQNPGDYARVHALLKAEGILTKHSLTMPTIMATIDGELVGAVGTTIQNKMIVAGPLVLDSKQRRTFTAIKLMEAYEIAMRGLKVTRYIVGIEQGSLLDEGVKRYFPHMTPYAHKDGQAFYVRVLDGSQERVDGN